MILGYYSSADGFKKRALILPLIVVLALGIICCLWHRSLRLNDDIEVGNVAFSSSEGYLSITVVMYVSGMDDPEPIFRRYSYSTQLDATTFPGPGETSGNFLGVSWRRSKSPLATVREIGLSYPLIIFLLVLVVLRPAIKSIRSAREVMRRRREINLANGKKDN
jgi:hypothetical protein